MSEAMIEVCELQRYFGEIHAVRGLSFAVYPGQVVGFIGANGAGKTTTMRLMATLDLQDAGVIRICGHDTLQQSREVRRIIGWMPDSYGCYEFVTVAEYLDFFARSYRIPTKQRKSRIDYVMEFTELSTLADRYVDTLSKGMSQRLCLGRTLLHDPQVLILDEPAAGLDPKARVEFKHLVKVLAEEGKTIFISSHILSELEDMCNCLLFIDSGSLVHHGSAEDLKRGSNTHLIFDIKVSGESARLEEWLLLHPGAKVVESIQNGFRIELENSSPDLAAGFLRALVSDGIPVIDFHLHQQRLEDAFIELVERRENGHGNQEPGKIAAKEKEL